MKVALIDYGSGNLRSVAKALDRAAADGGFRAEVRLVADPDEALRADRIVLPGVGAFGDCKRGLDAIPGMVDALSEAVVQNGRPFLGICVGMQLLATRGHEHGTHTGLNWIDGEVVPLSTSGSETTCPRRIPHMGWNSLNFKPNVHPIMAGISCGVQMYFVHSYHFVPANRIYRLADVCYGESLTAVVGRDTIVGTQFHPEKSQAAGLRVLQNFLGWSP